MTKENRIVKPKYIPDRFSNIEDWRLSRKKFIGGVFMAGLFVNLPVTSVISKGVGETAVLSSSQFSIVSSVQKILFPSDNNGPGAYDVMADKYLLWVLSDDLMDTEEKEYIIDGIGWVEETAEENFSKKYSELSNNEREKLIDDIAQESWGRSWLGVILTFIFEALLSDPQYGGNPDNIGWDWLRHNPGFPRPTRSLLYPEILKTVSKNTD